jgi:hypothetical protein
MTVYLDCRGTLDLFGIRLAEAARRSNMSIVVWSWAGIQAAKEIGNRYFWSEEYMPANKDYEKPQLGDIVVDDESDYWSDDRVCSALYLSPEAFLARFPEEASKAKIAPDEIVANVAESWKQL